jgi:hypothetical protein
MALDALSVLKATTLDALSALKTMALDEVFSKLELHLL